MRVRVTCVAVMITCAAYIHAGGVSSHLANGPVGNLQADGAERSHSGVAEPPDNLSGAVVISEDEFVRALAKRRYGPAAAGIRQRAIQVAVLLNDPAVHGVEGHVTRHPTLRSGILIIARSFDQLARGDIRAADLYVVAIRDAVQPTWALLSPRLLRAVDSRGQFSKPESKRIACVPRPGPLGVPLVLAGTGDAAAGLPAGVLLNAESPYQPRNGAGMTIELRLYPPSTSGAPANRFICTDTWPAVKPSAGDVRQSPSTIDDLETRWPLPKNAILISEDDYLHMLGATKASVGVAPIRGDDRKSNDQRSDRRAIVREAVALVAAANLRGARGVQATLTRGATPHSGLIVVARDWHEEGPDVSATEFYVVPLPMSSGVRQFGRDLFLNFPDGVPSLEFNATLCGPVSTPVLSPGCEFGYCTDFPTWQSTIGNYGGDRFQQGLSRTTLRWPSVTGRGGFDINVAACTLFQPPPPPPPSGSRRCDFDAFTGRPVLEVCNGRDDNCNGQIDEGNTCDASQSCPCQPRSCGTTTCGSIPDGCGNIIPCGAPCP
jgi:hypothetical protein